MPQHPLSREDVEKAIKAVDDAVKRGYVLGGGLPSAITEAARMLGVDRRKIDHRIMLAQQRYGIGMHIPTRSVRSVTSERALMKAKEETAPKPTLPDFPDDDIPVNSIIDLMCNRFEKRTAHREAKKWFRIEMPSDDPFAVMWWGDPHLDSNGCNWPLLKRHVELAKTPGVYSVNMGDTLDNWPHGSRLIRLYAHSDTSVETARKLAKWFMHAAGVQWLLWILGNHDCVTPDHEVLTQRGWIPIPEVAASDIVLGRNQGTGKAEWQPINEVVSFPYSGPMYDVSTRRMSIKCTPNHRFLCQSKGSAHFKYVFAEDLPKDFSVYSAAESAAPGAPLSDDEIRLAAWVLSDGSIDKRGNVSIYQSKPEGIEEIERVLAGVGVEYSKYSRQRDARAVCGRELVNTPLPSCQFAIAAASRAKALSIVPRKRELPEWASQMDQRQFGVFLDAYIMADGVDHAAERGAGNSAVIYGEREILDQLQALCVSHAVGASVSVDTRGDYRLNVCRKDFTRVAALRSVEHYAGMVHCLRVPLSNFMVRHNGKAHFTGNSWEGHAPTSWLKEVAGKTISLNDHGAQFVLSCPSHDFKVHAAHDFPGHSQFNPLHGGKRKAMSGEAADIYVCGHRHNWALHREEHPERGFTYSIIRARGYKYIDEHADALGLEGQAHGASILTVFDPRSGRHYNFEHPEDGVLFLNALRKRKAA